MGTAECPELRYGKVLPQPNLVKYNMAQLSDMLDKMRHFSILSFSRPGLQVQNRCCMAMPPQVFDEWKNDQNLSNIDDFFHFLRTRIYIPLLSTLTSVQTPHPYAYV